MRNLTAVVLFGALGLILPLAAMPIVAPGAIMPHDLGAAVEHLVSRGVKPMLGVTGGVAAAVRIADRTLFFNYGLADQAEKRPVTSDSLFNVGSVRKVFEAALVAEGAQRGELALDDPINKYVIELQGDYIRRVTVGELATHTSGLVFPTDHPPWPTEHYSLRGFLGALNAWTPPAGEEPGKQRIYTHAGYILLQLVLERRYGMPIGELLQQRILAPLGMRSTLVPERGPNDRAIMSAELLRRAVQGYSHTGEPIGLPGNQQGYFDFPGTGQMFSSARDLSILLAACLDERPAASPPTAAASELREALQLTQREAFRVNAQSAQAMAWEIETVLGTTIVDKPGGLNNASAYIGLVPDREIGLAVLVNRGDAFPFEAARSTILPELARLIRPTKPTAGATARQ